MRVLYEILRNEGFLKIKMRRKKEKEKKKERKRKQWPPYYLYRLEKKKKKKKKRDAMGNGIITISLQVFGLKIRLRTLEEIEPS